MTNEEKVQHWVNMSDYDMVTADAMMQAKRNLYVGFMCHLAVEKIFKAAYAKMKDETPPFSHDLEYIALQGGFYDKLSEEQKDFVLELTPLNIKGRYSEYKGEIAKMLTRDKCAEMLQQTKEIVQWTKEMLL